MFFEEKNLYELLFNINDSNFLIKIKSNNSFEDTYALIQEYEMFKNLNKLENLNFIHSQMIRYPILSNFMKLYKSYASTDFLKTINHIDVILEIDDDTICKDFLIKLVKSFKDFKLISFSVKDCMKYSLSNVKRKEYQINQYVKLYIQIINLFNKVIAYDKADSKIINLKKSFITRYILRYHDFYDIGYNYGIILDALYAMNTGINVFLSDEEYKYYSYISSERHRNISSYVSFCNTFKPSKELIMSHLMEVYGMQRDYVDGKLENNSHKDRLNNIVRGLLVKYNSDDKVFRFLNTAYDEKDTYLNKFLSLPQIKSLDYLKDIPFIYYSSDIGGSDYTSTLYSLSKDYTTLESFNETLDGFNSTEPLNKFMRRLAILKNFYEVCYVFKKFPDRIRNCIVQYDMSHVFNIIKEYVNRESNLLISCLSGVYLISSEKSILDVILKENVESKDLGNNLEALSNLFNMIYDNTDICFTGYNCTDDTIYNFMSLYKHSSDYLKFLNNYTTDNNIRNYVSEIHNTLRLLTKEYNYIYLNRPYSALKIIKWKYIELIKDYFKLLDAISKYDKIVERNSGDAEYHSFSGDMYKENITSIDITLPKDIDCIVKGLEGDSQNVHSKVRIEALKYYIKSDDCKSDFNHLTLLLKRLDSFLFKENTYNNGMILYNISKNIKNPTNISKLEYYYILIFINKYYKSYISSTDPNTKTTVFNNLIYDNSNFLSVQKDIFKSFNELRSSAYMQDVAYKEFKLIKNVGYWNSVQKNLLYVFHNKIKSVFNIDQINSLMYFFDFELLDEVQDTLDKCIILLANTRNFDEFIFWKRLYNAAEEYFACLNINFQSKLNHFISSEQKRFRVTENRYKDLISSDYQNFVVYNSDTLPSFKNKDKLNDLPYVLKNFTKLKHLYDENVFENVIESLLTRYVLTEYATYYTVNDDCIEVLSDEAEGFKTIFERFGIFYHIHYTRNLQKLELYNIYELLHVKITGRIKVRENYFRLLFSLFSCGVLCIDKYAYEIRYFKLYQYVNNYNILYILPRIDDDITILDVGNMLRNYLIDYKYESKTIFNKVKYRLLKYNVKKFNDSYPEYYVNDSLFCSVKRLWNKLKSFYSY